METSIRSLGHLSDDELLVLVPRLAQNEREATVSLIAHLAEFDKRALYLELGYSSLFAYCTQVLHFSEPAAYFRIQATRAVQRFPVILEKLAEGSVHLTAVALLKRHLTEENHLELLEAASYRSKKEVEALVARIRPLPPVPSSVRKLPSTENRGGIAGIAVEHARGGGVLECSPESTVGNSEPWAGSAKVAADALPTSKPAVVSPLAPERYKVQFTATAETHAKIRRLQDLLRHQIPDGDPAVIIDRALTLLLEKVERQKLAVTKRPRNATRPPNHSTTSLTSPTACRAVSSSRHIPAEVKRTVWSRDEGQCAFRGRDGRRCAERGRVEFHHVEPYAVGGPATIENISLRCQSHNGYEAEKAFGWRYPSQVRDQLRPDGVDRVSASLTYSLTGVMTIVRLVPDGVRPLRG